jgi:hypothetical protein
LQHQWFHPQDYLCENAFGYHQEFFSACPAIASATADALSASVVSYLSVMQDKRAVIFNSPTHKAKLGPLV